MNPGIGIRKKAPEGGKLRRQEIEQIIDGLKKEINDGLQLIIGGKAEIEAGLEEISAKKQELVDQKMLLASKRMNLLPKSRK